MLIKKFKTRRKIKNCFFNNKNVSFFDGSQFTKGVTHSVGSWMPDAWGLCDTSGNVREWTNDWYDANYYSNSPTVDPKGPTNGRYKARRQQRWKHFSHSFKLPLAREARYMRAESWLQTYDGEQMKGKKILIIQGGGRPKGNTFQLVGAFMEGIRDAGHRAEYISLNTHIVNGCLGCNACRYEKPCVQQDAFNDLRPGIAEADCIAMASPLLFWTISSKLKAFIERFYCLAQKDENPPLGRYEKYPLKDCVLLMTSADNFFWTYEQAVAYYRVAVINYIGFTDLGMYLAGGCGDTNGRPCIAETNHLSKVNAFGKNLY